ncbi:MAG TPA: hypothetical protein VMI10_05000 [Terriglobales bacterium]|nr:hypothetical protein [Terriglobales bacterium]
MTSLNQAYTRLDMQRRYEAWFLRFGLANGAGAWWLRYLLSNPGRSGCAALRGAAPAQVWATWFPAAGHPETFIQEFPADAVRLASGIPTLDGTKNVPSRMGHPQLSQGHPQFLVRIGANEISENGCRGAIEARGTRVSWDLTYRSHFAVTLSNKGWVGFSRTPHSDAVVAGEILFGERHFRGSPLGVGVQGHNCGFRHRNFWTWTHACFPQPNGTISTLEALVYEMPLGLRFRKAVLWHGGRAFIFRRLREHPRDMAALRWGFVASSRAGSMEVDVDGSGHSLHRLPYVKTDCSGMFEVSNNSRASARVLVRLRDFFELTTEGGAVLEMTGEY